MLHKISQLILTPGHNANTACDIFVAQPDSAKEALVGKLFVIIEVEAKRAEGSKIVEFLIDDISRNYYQNEKIILREKITGLKIEHIFEAALAKTNAHFAEFMDKEKIRINLSAINITAGVVHEGSLLFANNGKNKILLFYKRPADNRNRPGSGGHNRPDATVDKNRGEEEYSVTDIIEQTAGADGGQTNKGKLFTNVMNGQIPAKGHIFIANEAVPEYISGRQLTSIIASLPPLSAVEQIKGILEKINAYVSFLGIIIKSSAAEKPHEHKTADRLSTSQSIEGLNTTEDKTEDLLAPSGIINLKKWSKYFPFLAGQKDDQADNAGNRLYLKDKVMMKKSSFFASKKFGLKFKGLLVYLANAIFYVLKSVTGRHSLGAAVDSSASVAANMAARLRLGQIWTRYGGKGKLLIALFIIAMAAFLLNIAFMDKKKDAVEKNQAALELAALIEQKQNQAEANLLYNNEEGAKKLFGEIGDLIGQFPKETEEEKARLAEFQAKLDAQQEIVRHIVRVEEPAELANFLNLNGQANPNNLFFAEKNNRIYAADPGEQSVYILNTADKLVTTLTDLKLTSASLDSPALSGDAIYYIARDAVVAMDTVKETLKSVPIDAPSEGGYQSADIYNNRIYLLDNAKNQIHRYGISEVKYGSPAGWLTENTDLSTAADMSIDGHIYVLNKNGEVMKFLQGRRVEFELAAVEPPFADPTKIYVSPALEFIYVLEPSQKRLVLFDKTGRFLLQYQSSKFDNLKDFAIDEKNKIIYFLNGSIVYNVEATHL